MVFKVFGATWKTLVGKPYSYGFPIGFAWYMLKLLVFQLFALGMLLFFCGFPTSSLGYCKMYWKKTRFSKEFPDCARLRQELVFLRRELVFLRNLARPCAGVRLRILVFGCIWTPKQTFPTNSNQLGLI